MPKAEAAIRAAAEDAAAAKLRTPLPEQAPPAARRKSEVKEPEL